MSELPEVRSNHGWGENHEGGESSGEATVVTLGLRVASLSEGVASLMERVASMSVRGAGRDRRNNNGRHGRDNNGGRGYRRDNDG